MSVGSDVLDRLTADIDALVEADPSVPADPETIVALNRQLERLSAVNTRATATFDASGAWRPDGPDHSGVAGGAVQPARGHSPLACSPGSGPAPHGPGREGVARRRGG